MNRCIDCLPACLQEALNFPGIKGMTVGTWCLGPNPVYNIQRLDVCVECKERVGKRLCFSCPFRIIIRDNTHPVFNHQPRSVAIIALACSEACAVARPDGEARKVWPGMARTQMLDQLGIEQPLPDLAPVGQEGAVVPLTPFSMGEVAGGWYWWDQPVQLQGQQVLKQLVPWAQLDSKQRKKLKEHLLSKLVPRQQGWSQVQELKRLVDDHAPQELRDLVQEMEDAGAL